MITLLSGAHLTATDRRHLVALLEHFDANGFEPAKPFRIGRSKTYSITLVNNQLEATIVEPATDDFGRKFTRTYKSIITYRKAAA